MVREVQMKSPENESTLYPCTIQYILFPPHVVINPTIEQGSESECETDEGKFLIFGKKKTFRLINIQNVYSRHLFNF